LQDLTPLACESIKKISLTIQLCNTHLDEQDRRARVLDFVAKHLKGLRSLFVTVYDESDTFANFDARLRGHTSRLAAIEDREESRAELERMRLSAVNRLLLRWDMKWLCALAGIRGLSNFDLSFYTMVITSTDGWHLTEAFRQGPVTTQTILRECLEDRLCQPKQEVVAGRLPAPGEILQDDQKADKEDPGKSPSQCSLA
jgi:hypothetical protein